MEITIDGTTDAATPLPHLTVHTRGVPSDLRFQILSLDGGGYRGIYAAAILACWERDLETSLVPHFDLVTGTSTGGIIALLLGAGMRPAEIVEFYVRSGPGIVPRARFRKPVQIFRTKYDAGPLRDALEGALGDKRLAESVIPLIVSAYDLCNDEVHLFRTPHSSLLRRDYRERMVDVALATSAAPTYLPVHPLRGLRLVDGGVFANNPSILGVAEAVSKFGVALHDIRVLSIGTTSEVRARPSRLDRGGLWAWRRDAVDVILRGQSLAARNAVLHLIGPDNLLRVDRSAPAGLLRLDGLSSDALMGRAENVSRHYSARVAEQFIDHVARPYLPFYSP
jgi:predicted acylesterase/phospholipase RssA